MLDGERFPFRQRTDEFGSTFIVPDLPLTLTYGDRSLDVVSLVDSGSSVNVLPYEIGLQLGAVWEEQTTSVRLTGNLARFPARGLLLTANIAQFQPVKLVFAWTEATVPLLLGQVNFFAEFDVCFYGYQQVFAVKPSSAASR
jgi:hypothetical protein